MNSLPRRMPTGIDESDGEHADRQGGDRAAQGDVDEGLVDGADQARDRVVGLAADLAADQQVAQRGREGDAQQRRGEHDEGLGVGERLEEAAGLALEAEDGDERDGDDQQREEDRGGDLAGGLGEELAGARGSRGFWGRARGACGRPRS
jgi:hypothetical protein